MDLVHSWGVELAVYLQTKHSGYQDLFSLASTVADLHTTFFLFFPIWFHLRRDTALRLIWVAVLGDWLNLVLKWYEGAGGDRRTARRRESVCSYRACLPMAGFCLGRGRTGGFRRPAFMAQDRDQVCSSSPLPVRPDQVQFGAEGTEWVTCVVQGTIDPEA